MGAARAGTGPVCPEDEEVLAVFVSRYMPCELCGESLDTAVPRVHRCSPERRLDFQMFALRSDVAGVEEEVWAYLESPHGRFDVWLASKELRERR
jgi:hypothetical protein